MFQRVCALERQGGPATEENEKEAKESCFGTLLI